jgi:hypothetical protein
LLHDAFICHASEDKDDFVRPLAEALRAHHIEVWYDEFTLGIGDSLREAIDRGLSQSRFGIVVLSPSFFQKSWPKRELSGLVARETSEDRQLILPIWHNVEREHVLQYSPPLADLLAVSSEAGIANVIDALQKKLRPKESPLIVARDFLIERGVVPPVITDEWWLDIVETKEAQFLYPDLNLDWRWIFPLPYPEGYRGRERGLNIAWTALQLDWSDDGKRRDICQLTRPEVVHAFLKEWPGLLECAQRNPATLALYAPQLTIPGFDEGFANVFDVLMEPEHIDECDAFRYSGPDTTDGKEPLCGDFVAWRHPSFGNYTASELSYQFVNAHSGSYSRKLYDGFQCLVWLIGDDASWMPSRLRDVLKQGFRDHAFWWMSDLCRGDDSDAIADAVFDKSMRVDYTKALKTALIEQCSRAMFNLRISGDPNSIAQEFIERAFIEGYHEQQIRIREAQNRR